MHNDGEKAFSLRNTKNKKMKKIILEKNRIVYANDSFLNFFEVELKEVMLKNFEMLGFKIFGKIRNRAFVIRQQKADWITIEVKEE